MKLKGFLAGLAGGAVAAAAVVLLLVFVFDIGAVSKTVVQATPETPTVYSTPSASTTGGGLTPEQIYSTLSGGVVMVLAEFGGSGTDQFGQPQSAQALGTGFVVDSEGYILTNAHVVDENGQRANSVTVVFNKGGSETQRVPGQLVGVDIGSDVAVIKVDPAKVDLKPLPLGDSDDVVVGEPVVAIGNPLGYDFSITSGIVSATGRSLQAPNGQTIPNGIQTDAAINQGNSGGPLIDSAGNVIGINEQIATSGGGNQGLGFAVPINTAVHSLEQLKADGKVTYAWMGVSLQTLTSDIAGMFNMQTQGGALVQAVSPDSPASKAGIQGGDQTVTVQGEQFTIGGDVIVKVDNTEVKTADDLIAYLGTKKPGDTVTVTVERDGKTEEVDVTLAE
ncbi:MAG TPA: trypsin-like peptidase domain-containing protein, partial [Ilumatobacteraceae bacterium]|nr:trypsin-like peptidase domain-containing protein [Ilumatobacteraceae bacterium]